MRMVDIIEKKRDGGKLTKEEIEFFVNGYVNGEIPDYQASALLMAIYFRHMDYDETLNLTPPVLCLSTLTPSIADKSSLSPLFSIARVRLRVSS